MNDEGKLIPILREGIDVIKMVFFQKLKAYLSVNYAEHDAIFINRLTGAIINRLFGTRNEEEPFATFVRENDLCIGEEMGRICTQFQEMRIPLTDALRIQFFCDHQDGIDSAFVLVQARDLGILIVDREVPLPARFMSLVRTLGSKLDLLARV